MDNWIKNASLLLTSRVISGIGTQLSKVAFILAFKEHTTPFVMSLYFTVLTLPGMIIPLFSSWLASKVSPRKIVIACDLLSTLVMFCIFLIVVFWGWEETYSIILSLLLALSCFSAMYGPLGPVLVKGCVPVEKVTTYASVSQPTINAAYSLGEFLSSILLKIISSTMLLLIDSLTFLVSFIMISKIKMTPFLSSEKISFLKHTKNTIKLISNKSITSRLNFIRIYYILIDTLIFVILPYLMLDPSNIGLVLGFNTIGFVLAGFLNTKIILTDSQKLNIIIIGSLVTVLLLAISIKLNYAPLWAFFILIKGLLNGNAAIYSFKKAIETLSDYEIGAYISGTVIINSAISIMASWVLGAYMTKISVNFTMIAYQSTFLIFLLSLVLMRLFCVNSKYPVNK